MPRHKSWSGPEAAGYSAMALEVMEAVGVALDSKDPTDARILAECALKGPGVADPDGAHVYLGGPASWAHARPDVGPADDCPDCGSTALFDDSGNPCGYSAGFVQARPGPPSAGAYGVDGRYTPAPPGPARPTLDTCERCSRSGMDRSLNAHQVRQQGRLDHLIRLKLTQGDSPVSDADLRKAPQGIAATEPDPNPKPPATAATDPAPPVTPPATPPNPAQAVAPNPPGRPLDPQAYQKATQLHNAIAGRLAQQAGPPEGAGANVVTDGFKAALDAFKSITPEQWAAALAFARSLGIVSF